MVKEGSCSGLVVQRLCVGNVLGWLLDVVPSMQLIMCDNFVDVQAWPRGTLSLQQPQVLAAESFACMW